MFPSDGAELRMPRAGGFSHLRRISLLRNRRRSTKLLRRGGTVLLGRVLHLLVGRGRVPAAVRGLTGRRDGRRAGRDRVRGVRGGRRRPACTTALATAAAALLAGRGGTTAVRGLVFLFFGGLVRDIALFSSAVQCLLLPRPFLSARTFDKPKTNSLIRKVLDLVEYRAVGAARGCSSGYGREPCHE